MIQRILVANRGEIARRVIRTCARLRIETVAIYSDGDAGEPHVSEADLAVHLPGESAAETYLDMEAVLDAARQADADAIHPGYGFLSENAEFAASVIDAGLTWIGPSPSAIARMGSKLEAKALMKEAGVPCLPGADLTGMNESAIEVAAAEIGFPVLVKASAGGGGKGMRAVDDQSGLLAAVEGARREAKASFGDETVFLEKLLTGPRHIEIQVIGDSSGQIISLYERECSIQRRHQKIIEESPSPVMTPEMRDTMGKAAVSAARAVDYVGAGTVEFLYQDGSFYFLEMNTRLQVEHPVTEMVTGLDIVELQIAIADGSPLPEEAIDPGIHGHAIEARLYAEDPANDFLPVTGPVHAFSFQSGPEVRVDSGIAAGSTVTVHFDPMLAKVIAHAGDRAEAAAVLADALRRARVHSATTNRDLLVRILEHPDFLAGRADTGFIEAVGLEELSRPLISGERITAYAAAAAIADRDLRLQQPKVQGSIPPGFRNIGTDRQEVDFTVREQTVRVIYENSPGGPELGSPPGLALVEHDPGRVVLETPHGTLDLAVARYGEVRYIDSAEGSVRLLLEPRFPGAGRAESEGSLHAPMPGKIVRIEVDAGQRVEEGDPLIVMEAMKMEHTLRAPHEGVVAEIDCAVGDQVQANDILIVVN